MKCVEDLPDFEIDDYDYDPLFDVTDLQTGTKYVDEVLKLSSPTDVLRYVEIHLGLRDKPGRGSRSARRGKKQGGALAECDDLHPIQVYRLLCLADSIHDSCPRSGAFNQTPQKILNYMNMTATDIPRIFTLDQMNDEEFFINAVRSKKSLAFADEMVENPLYGCDLTHFDRSSLDDEKMEQKGRVDTLTRIFRAAMSKVQRDSNKQSRILNVPVYTQWEFANTTRRKGVQKVQFQQILDLATRMRQRFGQNCVYQPDMYSPLFKFLLATKFISQAFHKKFVIDKNWNITKYSTEIREAVMRAGDGAAATWELRLCDANVFDASPITDPIPYVREPTGVVFRKEQLSNVRLEGLSSSNVVSYTITTKNQPSRTVRVTKAQAEVSLSTNTLFSRLPGGPDSRGTVSMAEADMLLTLKRCGDFAQVEAAKRSGRIFVTEDRLAAMYAYYRGAKFMLWRAHDFSEMADHFVQYSCVLGT